MKYNGRLDKNFVLGLFILVFSLMGCSLRQERESPKPEKTMPKTVRIGNRIGDRAPDIKYRNPQEKLMSLNEAKGKIVLIDFWASWCPPCRLENPNLVKNYRKFKDKEFKNGNGFTIFSVSLDRSKEPWMEAIKSDNLDWEYHVSDLKGWYSVPAAMYQVQSIPSNFLIDGDGIIIAKNLRGEQLELTLDTFLK